MISFLLSVHRAVRVVLAILYVGCIVALSLLPPKDFPQVQLFEGADKVVHFLMYYIFSFLGCWALKAELKQRVIWLILPVATGWGLLMEVFQFEMHIGRTFSWYDMLANAVGVVVGIAVYKLIVINSYRKKVRLL